MSVDQRRLALQALSVCTAGLLLTSPGAQAQSSPLPVLKQAGQTRLLQQADAQYQRYSAAPDAFFAQGDTSKGAWPCTIPAAQMEALTGISNYAFGDAASGYGHRYSDVAVHPLSARCKDGKLDGQVELVYEAVRTSWGPNNRSRSRETGRVVATIAGGKLIHRLELRQSVDLAGEDAGSQPASAPLARAAASSIASSAETPAGPFIESATILVSGDARKYFLKRPVKTARGTRLEKTFFNGTTLVSVEQTDARGKPDGLALSYTDGKAQRRCFRQGKPVAQGACGG